MSIYWKIFQHRRNCIEGLYGRIARSAHKPRAYRQALIETLTWCLVNIRTQMPSNDPKQQEKNYE